MFNNSTGQQVGYKRVSSCDQTNARQLADLSLDVIFEDKITGSVKHRPELDRCIQHCRLGDTLHIHSIDRLARSLVHLLEILERLLAKGVRIQFHKENLLFEGADNPTSKLILHVMGAVAEWERTMIKERQREGIAQARVNGTKSGKPFGKQPLDPKLKPQAITLCDDGLNISQIAKSLNISRASVYKLLEGHTKQVTY